MERSTPEPRNLGTPQPASRIIPASMDDRTPRHLQERTGKHRCIRCLAEVSEDVYFANDQVCDECAEKFEKELTVEKQDDR